MRDARYTFIDWVIDNWQLIFVPGFGPNNHSLNVRQIINGPQHRGVHWFDISLKRYMTDENTSADIRSADYDYQDLFNKFKTDSRSAMHDLLLHCVLLLGTFGALQRSIGVINQKIRVIRFRKKNGNEPIRDSSVRLMSVYHVISNTFSAGSSFTTSTIPVQKSPEET